MKSITSVMLIAFILFASTSSAEPEPVKVGICTVLTGELGLLGQNITRSAETYKKHYLRHAIEFSVEDGKVGSNDGLRAVQKLVNVDRVHAMIGGCSTNGLVASKALINSSRTPTISVVTGGKAADGAGPYVFRIGNSDTLNGELEA